MKGLLVEVWRGSQDHQRVGKHPEISSSEKLSALLPPPSLKELGEWLELGKISLALGGSPQYGNGGLTASAKMWPHMKEAGA